MMNLIHKIRSSVEFYSGIFLFTYRVRSFVSLANTPSGKDLIMLEDKSL